MFYKIVIECGHVGAGKGFDVVRYFKGNNASDILAVARKMPRAKTKKTSNSIKLVKAITEKEYRAGLNIELSNPYLSRAQQPGYV